MALTDLGLRTLVRMEATAEFYAAPRIWFLGANKGQVSPDTWGSIVSVINGIPAGRNGEKPELRQLTQASMQPHSDMLKTVALMVSSETDIPVNDLGITMNNPASAEAMAEAERKLSRTADRQNKRFGESIKSILAMALAAQGADEAASANCGRSGHPPRKPATPPAPTGTRRSRPPTQPSPTATWA